MIRGGEGVHKIRQGSREHLEERIANRVPVMISVSVHQGERQHYFSLPHRVVCSSMWGTPVSSGGLVLKPMEKTLFLSSLATCIYSAPVFSCCKCKAVSCSSGTCLERFSVKPCSCSPGSGKLLRSVMEAYVRRRGHCLECDRLRPATLGSLEPHLDQEAEGTRSIIAVSLSLLPMDETGAGRRACWSLEEANACLIRAG